MEHMDISVLLKEWASLIQALEQKFGDRPTLETVLFLVGVQEFGKAKKGFSKDEKQDLIHIGTCKALSYWGIYRLNGQDKDGWPIWDQVNDIPYMDLSTQSKWIRQGLIRYFRESGFNFG